MRGHLVKRAKDSWSVAIYQGKDLETNKKIYKWFTVHGTKTEAEMFLTEKLREMDTGIFIDSKNMNLQEYLYYWYHQSCITRLSPTTYESYKRNMDKHIIPILGKVALKDLSPLHLQSFYMYCSKNGLSNTTIRYIHRILHSALKQAMKWQLVIHNIADNVEPPKAVCYNAIVLDDKQTKKLIQVLENSPLYLPVMIAIGTGMRRGEILGLTWENVDLENGTIKVVQTLTPTKNGLKFLPPKTQKSNRIISVPPTLLKILSQQYWKQQQNRKILSNTYCQEYNLVCCADEGFPISPSSLNHRFQKLLKANSLPPIRFHDLRHSHASLLLKQGVSAKAISERLGHSTIKITMDLYSHIYEATNKEIANNFDEFLQAN